MIYPDEEKVTYTNNALYRLTGATGTYTDADSKTASYTLAMDYYKMHRITLKSQRIESKNGDFVSYGSDPRRIQYAGSEAAAMRTMTENIRHIRMQS
ncbi:hypothetical protein [Bacteroides cellulosilyticus]|uniref:hypothetical protein n=1 Tax=Bacteroides cellulosilyticus TaxID=246787 RepID=UPI0032EF0934